MADKEKLIKYLEITPEGKTYLCYYDEQQYYFPVDNPWLLNLILDLDESSCINARIDANEGLMVEIY